MKFDTAVEAAKRRWDENQKGFYDGWSSSDELQRLYDAAMMDETGTGRRWRAMARALRAIVDIEEECSV